MSDAILQIFTLMEEYLEMFYFLYFCNLNKGIDDYS